MEHISAVKFDMGYEKNMSFRVIPKSSKSLKKVEKMGLGSFNISYASHTRHIEYSYSEWVTYKFIKM